MLCCIRCSVHLHTYSIRIEYTYSIFNQMEKRIRRIRFSIWLNVKVEKGRCERVGKETS